MYTYTDYENKGLGIFTNDIVEDILFAIRFKGKSTKNLVKNIKRIEGNEEYNYNYTYKFDAEGYVTEMTESITEDWGDNVYKYKFTWQ